MMKLSDIKTFDDLRKLTKGQQIALASEAYNTNQKNVKFMEWYSQRQWLRAIMEAKGIKFPQDERQAAATSMLATGYGKLPPLTKVGGPTSEVKKPLEVKPPEVKPPEVKPPEA